MKWNKDSEISWKAEAEKHAFECYPNEACGLIVRIKNNHVYLPCINKSKMPSEHFMISAEDYSNAEDLGEIVGLFHSHPDASPELSEADKVVAEGLGFISHTMGLSRGENLGWRLYKPIGYKVPLVGREWNPPILDCYSLIRDYYQRELGINLVEIEHDMEFDDRGEDLYGINCEKVGFVNLGQTRDIKEHDLIVMQIRSKVPNHGAIYLGKYQIKSENVDHIENSILHHTAGRLSRRDLYTGYWYENTSYVFRHKELL